MTTKQEPWVLTKDGKRFEGGEWVVGGFRAADGTFIPNDDIADSSEGAPRRG